MSADIERLAERFREIGDPIVVHLLAKAAAIARSHNAPERFVGLMRRFDSETAQFLIKEGCVIYDLKGESLAQLRQHGLKFASSWYAGWDFDNKKSKPTQVAFNPDRFILDGSNRKIRRVQEEMLFPYKNQLCQRIAGIKVIEGDLNAYAEVIGIYKEKTGRILLEEVLRVQTVDGFYTIGDLKEEGLQILSSQANERVKEHKDICIAPLIVPA